MDPRTGEYGNWAKPFPKSAWNEVAAPHTVTIVHADGSESVVTIAGATHTELRDQDFVLAVVTGDWDRWLMKRRVTNEQWHAFLVKLAEQHPEKVLIADCVKPIRPDDLEVVA
jgi:hypothetical protein